MEATVSKVHLFVEGMGWGAAVWLVASLLDVLL